MEQGLDYTYGGQWFDDMGALAAAFPDGPTTGIDIARAGLTRAQANDMAKNLIRSGITPYDEEEVPDLGMGMTGA
jgi:hypothetical protein